MFYIFSKYLAFSQVFRYSLSFSLVPSDLFCNRFLYSSIFFWISSIISSFYHPFLLFPSFLSNLTPNAFLTLLVNVSLKCISSISPFVSLPHFHSFNYSLIIYLSLPLVALVSPISVTYLQ